MTGVASQIVAADIVFGSSGVAEAERPFFNLGAISLAMTDFIGSQPDLAAGNAPLFEVWRPIIAVLADSPGPPPAPGIISTLKQVREILGRARKIADDAKANFITSLEAKAQLLGMIDEITALSGLSTTIRTQVSGLATLPATLFTTIQGMRPAHKSPPATRWSPRDLFHWSRTGKFFEVVRRRARESGDPQLMAFAAGLGVAYGGALAGNPFRNGVAGGPLRNHFWRSRALSHRIDAWVWGYYRTQAELRASASDITFSAANRVPSPPIASWKNLVGADLQRHFEIGGISPSAVLTSIGSRTPIAPFLPASVVSLWLDSMNEAYPDGVPAGLDAVGIQSAYALTWLTAWIQTSPDCLRAIPPDQINWPDDCGPRPSWAAPDGSIFVGGAPITPPTPAIGKPSAAKIASAIALALLALANFLAGNIAGGIEALAAAAALADAGTPPNWDQLSCDLGWTDGYIIGLENAFRALLVTAGIAPPYCVELRHNEPAFAFSTTPNDPDIIPPDAAVASCWSPNRRENRAYPHGPWNPVTSNWTRYPTEAVEEPATTSWASSVAWPNAFLDGISVTTTGTPPVLTTAQINPVEVDPQSGRPTVLDKDEWDRRMMRAEAGGNPGFVPFGNAVDLALTINASEPGSLLDWDLDGDRGIGWPTWVWPSAAATNGAVKRE